MKRRDRNPRLVNFSRLGLKCKPDSQTNPNQDSTQKPDKISKYFVPTSKSDCEEDLNADDGVQDEGSQSHEISLTDIANFSAKVNTSTNDETRTTEIENFTAKINTLTNDDDDFRTPKNFRKKIYGKMSKTKPNLKSSKMEIKEKRGGKPRDKRKSRQMTLTKTVKQNLGDTDGNPEHLQLALALSRSLHSNNKSTESQDEDYMLPNTQQKRATIKQTLIQFGFKSNTKRIAAQNYRTPIERNKKKSSYRYITPVLFLRTEEDRQKLISDKITIILSTQILQPSTKLDEQREPSSEALRQQWNDNGRIFKMSGLEPSEIAEEAFYVKSLNLPQSKPSCGSLLKDWNQIPGREPSPSRTSIKSHENVAGTSTKNQDINSNFEEGKIADNPQQIDNNKATSSSNNIDSLDKTFKNNLRILSFTSNRSISPELFDSDDEAIGTTPKTSQQSVLSISSDSEEQSPSPIHLTPRKKVVTPPKQLTPHHQDLFSDQESSSESLLSLSPRKKIRNKIELELDSTKTSTCTRRLNNISVPSDIWDNDIFVNDNGIHSFECFSKDLAWSSDEENDGSQHGEEPHIKDPSFENADRTLSKSSPFISTGSSSTVDISEIMEKSLHFQEQTTLMDDKKATRRTRSLNVTEYVSNVLDEEHGDLEHLSQKSTDLLDNEVLDLTQSSTDSSTHNDQSLNNSNCRSPSKSNNVKFDKHDSFQSTASDELSPSQASQESVICISDEELNYSSRYGTPFDYAKSQKNMYEFSHEEEEVKPNLTPKTSNHVEDANYVQVQPLTADGLNNMSDVDHQVTLQLQHPRVTSLSRDNSPRGAKSKKSLFNEFEDTLLSAIPENSHHFEHVPESNNGVGALSTPSKEAATSTPDETIPKSEMVIKTTNITPMSNYDEMNTPKIAKELQKFGLKPLKRQRGAQILKHIYESTHPVVARTCDGKTESDDEDQRVIKRRKSNLSLRKTTSPKPCKSNHFEPEFGVVPLNISYDEEVVMGMEQKIDIIGDLFGAKENDLVFERKQSSKVPSCRVPLHIAWHNLVSSQPELRQSILLYEPLHLEKLYKALKEQGYKYHIEDLLTFLDKKCVTIRTNQNQSRRRQCSKKFGLPRKRTKSASPRKSK